MDWIYYGLLLIVLITGWLINLFGAPGLWLMLAGVGGYAWITHQKFINMYWLIALVAIALLAELLEFLSAGAAVKKAGGSKRGMIGAIIGGVLGGFFLTFSFPIVGTIVGICAGTFLGATAAEVLVGKEVIHSTRIGASAAKGRLIGTMIKLAFGFVILVLSLWRCLPIGASTPPAIAGPTSAPSTAPATTTPSQR